MTTAYLVDGVRTPIGRYAGALASVRPDDLDEAITDAWLARAPRRLTRPFLASADGSAEAPGTPLP